MVRKKKQQMTLGRTEARRVVSLLESLCCEALIEDHGLSRRAAQQRLNQELDYYRNLRIGRVSLEDVFSQFFCSLANRQGLLNLAFGARAEFSARLAAYKKTLAGFRPRGIVRKYRKDEKRLLRDLMAARGFTREQAQRQRRGAKAQFPIFSQGVLAGAHYFCRFENGKDFVKFVRKWLDDPDMVAMLPEYLAAVGIPGFGPALAANFLKLLFR